MTKFSMSLLVALFAIAFCFQGALADNQENEYFKSISEFYNVDLNEVTAVAEQGINIEELPVVFFLSAKAEVEAGEIVELRENGTSWADISTMFSVKPVNHYFQMSKYPENSSYTEVLDKLFKTHKSEYDNIQLTDADIINLSNLRLIHKKHAYDLFRVIELKDAGTSFVQINQIASKEYDKFLANLVEEKQILAQKERQSKSTLEAR
jgi:hypothetical protein